MAVFYTADTHFGEERALTLSRRPFANVSEMDNTMVRRWNRLVQPDDTVYHLGDFGDPNTARRLKGHIIFLLGNYEREAIAQGEITLVSLRGYFSQVIEEPVLLHTLEGTGEQIALVHEPSHRRKELFNLFGHIHQLQMVKRNGLNVGVDCHNFTPVSLETVLFYKEAIQKHYDQEVFME
jgi:calcineurin-like phosphoesterase family protein